MPLPDALPRKPRWSAARIMIATMAGALVFGGVAGFLMGREEGTGGPSTATVSIFAWGLIIVMILACLVTIPYWRRLDEAAREAHKAAWLWGGGAAYVLAVILGAGLLLTPAGAALPSVTGRGDAAGHAADAVMFVVALQSFGYCIGWAIWWLRAR